MPSSPRRQTLTGPWEGDEIPSRDVVSWALQSIARDFGLGAEDAEDVVFQALLEWCRIRKLEKATNGLFVILVKRRAIDLIRARARWRSLRPRVPSQEPPETSLLELSMAQAVEQFLRAHPAVDGQKLRTLARNVVFERSFSAACRQTGLPRGSEGFYRRLLQACFAGLVTRRTATAGG